MSEMKFTKQDFIDFWELQKDKAQSRADEKEEQGDKVYHAWLKSRAITIDEMLNGFKHIET